MPVHAAAGDVLALGEGCDLLHRGVLREGKEEGHEMQDVLLPVEDLVEEGHSTKKVEEEEYKKSVFYF